MKKLVKFGPIIFAALVAAAEAWDAMKNEEKMEDLERRLAELESKQ